MDEEEESGRIFDRMQGEVGGGAREPSHAPESLAREAQGARAQPEEDTGGRTVQASKAHAREVPGVRAQLEEEGERRKVQVAEAHAREVPGVRAQPEEEGEGREVQASDAGGPGGEECGIRHPERFTEVSEELREQARALAM